MKRLIATPTYVTNLDFTALMRVDIVSDETRKHERNAAASDAAMRRRTDASWRDVMRHAIEKCVRSNIYAVY